MNRHAEWGIFEVVEEFSIFWDNLLFIFMRSPFEFENEKITESAEIVEAIKRAENRCEKLLEMVKEPVFVSALKTFGDSAWLSLHSKMVAWLKWSYRIFLVHSRFKDYEHTVRLFLERSSSLRKDFYFIFNYLEFVLIQYSQELEPTAPRKNQLRFCEMSGEVTRGDEVRKLALKTDEYYFFMHLFESNERTSFNEAKNRFPQLDNGNPNSTRLKHKINESLWASTVVSDSNGYRINPIYQLWK